MSVTQLMAQTKDTVQFEFFKPELYTTEEVFGLIDEAYKDACENIDRSMAPTYADVGDELYHVFIDAIFRRALICGDVYWGGTNIQDEVKAAIAEGKEDDYIDNMSEIISESVGFSPSSEFGELFFNDVRNALTARNLFYMDTGSFNYEITDPYNASDEIFPIANSPVCEVW